MLRRSECFCPFTRGYDEWDYLIILDACRYDYFAALYSYFLYGELQRVWSCSSNTYEYCTKCIPNNEDRTLIYISANPYINSYHSVGKCNARLYVGKVLDAWSYLWDYNLGTVPPDKLTRYAANIIKRNPDKRIVVHYLQPHAPYLVPYLNHTGYPDPRRSQTILFGSREMERYNKLLHLEGLIIRLINKVQKLGLKGAFMAYLRARRLLGLPPLNPVDDFIRKYGLESLSKAYAYNLTISLASIAVLVEEIRKVRPDAKIVITSDHGECLGEEGLLEHPSGEAPCLRTIPFFVVKFARKRAAVKYMLKWRVRLARMRGKLGVQGAFASKVKV